MHRALFLVLLVLVPASLEARVSLGLLGGAVLPHGNRAGYDLSFSGAYVVDLPVYSAFHLMPYAEIYKLKPDQGKGAYTADAGLGFNFVVRTTPLKPLFGFTVGATPVYDQVRLDVGFQAGVQWKIVANFSLLFLGRYNIAIGDDDNLKRFHAGAGFLFDL
jgi:hypothetical protein